MIWAIMSRLCALMSVRAISMPANSGTLRRSETSFLVKPTLPAPMMAILKVISRVPSVQPALRWSTRAKAGSQSPWAARRSLVSAQIWSRSSSAAVCGSSMAAW